MSGVPLRSVLELMLFNICVSDMDNKTVSKFDIKTI